MSIRPFICQSSQWKILKLAKFYIKFVYIVLQKFIRKLNIYHNFIWDTVITNRYLIFIIHFHGNGLSREFFFVLKICIVSNQSKILEFLFINNSVNRNNYYDVGVAISSSRKETEYNLGGKQPGYQATVDILTSFTIIIGIFFPSVTGTTIITLIVK